MEEQPFNIPIDEPKKEFEKHLAPDYNKRIIFSAPFGTGKTYFLNKFFKERETNEKVIRLFPVNYSVSSNEDVFELIKFDILLQLIEDDAIELDDNSFSTFFIAQFFLLQNAGKVVEWILNRFVKVGKAVNKHAKMIDRVVKAYQKFEHEMQTNADKSTAVDFLFTIKNQQGTAYENDAITNLICGLIQQYEENNQKTVLIIDDLDRIDPEHIFRLLNVFAAHFDIGALDTNKFGFDKVIFVCDINNIRNIFHAKYGTDTDFTGYIDKFFSTDVFNFINANTNTFSYIKRTIIYRFVQLSINNTELNNKRDFFYYTFSEVLTQLYITNTLNIRALRKLYENTIIIPNYQLTYKFSNREITSYQSMIVITFEILKSIYGDYKSVLKALNAASKYSNSAPYNDRGMPFDDDITQNYWGHCLPILISDRYFEHEVEGKTFRHEILELGISMEFEQPAYKTLWRSGFIYTRAFNFIGINGNSVSKNHMKLLEITFEKLQSFGHLKD